MHGQARPSLERGCGMSEPLIIALPSKGRLKDQVEAWLEDCGLPLRSVGGVLRPGYPMATRVLGH